MTKEEYDNFRLRYKNCGFCLPLISDLNKSEKKWFTAIQKDIAELEAQIEKMKCCSNCKHFNKEDDLEYCWNCERQLVNSLDNLSREEIIKDEWEIKEK